MTGTTVPPSLSPETLFAKSKVYIKRALAAKDREQLDEYQLWASLSLELVGKAALAGVHPCLIADPTSATSMFAAAGHSIGPDVKTITAKTLFDRLPHVSKEFDQKTARFCIDLSLRRNAELHSGEASFEATISDTWEGRFWNAIETILAIRDDSIETWLGVDAARPTKELLAHFKDASAKAALARVANARERFLARSAKDRNVALESAEKLSTYDYKAFRLVADAIWTTRCPACQGRAFLAGIEIAEKVSSEFDPDYPDTETVDTYFGAEEFLCPTCGLRLDARRDIEAVGIDADHVETSEREREYEPEYGND